MASNAKGEDLPKKEEEKDETSTTMHFEASQRPAYIGIHGGTAPISLLRAPNGLLVAFTGQTGNDFVLTLQNNASQRGKGPNLLKHNTKSSEKNIQSMESENEASKEIPWAEKIESQALSDQKDTFNSFHLSLENKILEKESPVEGNENGKNRVSGAPLGETLVAEQADILNKTAENLKKINIPSSEFETLQTKDAKTKDTNPNLTKAEKIIDQPTKTTSLESTGSDKSSLAEFGSINKDEVIGAEVNEAEPRTFTEEPEKEPGKDQKKLADKSKAIDRELELLEPESEVKANKNPLPEAKPESLASSDFDKISKETAGTKESTLPEAFKKHSLNSNTKVVFAQEAGFEFPADNTMLPFGLSEYDKPRPKIIQIIEKKIEFSPLILNDYRSLL